MSSKYLRIGQIVRAHGVQGDVKLIPTTDDIRRFQGLDSAYLERGGEYLPQRLSNIRVGAAAVLLHMEGTDTPEAAEKLRGLYLCADRAHAAKLPPDTWFVADLIGCETSDTEGKAYGPVTDVLVTGASDVYEIEGGKLLVPALKKLLVSVDTEGKRIIFDAAVLREVGLFAD